MRIIINKILEQTVKEFQLEGPYCCPNSRVHGGINKCDLIIHLSIGLTDKFGNIARILLEINMNAHRILRDSAGTTQRCEYLLDCFFEYSLYKINSADIRIFITMTKSEVFDITVATY